MGDTMVMRSIRCLVEKQRTRLQAASVLADLEPFRVTVDQVRGLGEVSPAVVETVELLESEIRERGALQERAARVGAAR